MAATKKGGGGKLSRSEVVTIRLDPKLRFAAELAAKKQRRTLSSFIEWSIEQSIQQEAVAYDTHDNRITAYEAMNSVWDVEESDRFINLAFMFPELLSFDEEKRWKLIKEHPYFFLIVKRSHNNYLSWEKCPMNIDNKKVRECWSLLNKILSGEADEDAIPPVSPGQITEKDEGVPF